ATVPASLRKDLPVAGMDAFALVMSGHARAAELQARQLRQELEQIAGVYQSERAAAEPPSDDSHALIARLIELNTRREAAIAHALVVSRDADQERGFAPAALADMQAFEAVAARLRFVYSVRPLSP